MFVSSILGSFASYLSYGSVSWCMQVCTYLWSMQQCVLVSPGKSIVSPCLQFLVMVKMRISRTLFLFGGCFCSLFIKFWGNIKLIQEWNFHSEEGNKEGKRGNLNVKAVLSFFF